MPFLEENKKQDCTEFDGVSYKPYCVYYSTAGIGTLKGRTQRRWYPPALKRWIGHSLPYFIPSLDSARFGQQLDIVSFGIHCFFT